MESGVKRAKAGLAGAGLLASLAAVRAVATAGETAVLVGGRELPWACPVKSLLGLPCPSCGMTRSVVLTLAGDLRGAVEMNPAGPLVVLGLLALAALLIFKALRPAPVKGARPVSLPLRPARVAAAYGALVLAVMLVNWALALA